LFAVFYSCETKKVSNNEDDEDKIFYQSLLAVKKNYSIEQAVNASTLLKIEDWKHYKDLSEFIKENFIETSPNHSFEMSKELVDHVQMAKDSLRIKELRKLGVFARLNTLYSESLRLKDMSNISSIKAEEVEVQTEKILSIFSSINAKLNAVYEQNEFDENVEFDESIFDFREEPQLAFPKSKRKGTKRKTILPSRNRVK
jgi:hypothetical protein